MTTWSTGYGLAIVRVVTGIILIVAGLEKYAAGGFDGFTRVTTGLGLPLPGVWGIWIPLQELIGGVLIVLGLGTRWVAILFVIEFVVTSFALKAVRPAPFGGWDSMRIDLMLLAASIALVASGPGAFALDHLVRRRAR